MSEPLFGGFRRLCLASTVRTVASRRAAVFVGEGERQVESANGAGRRLGALLLEQGAISEDDMAQALAVQGEDGKRLGEILLDHDLVSRPLLARVLAEQIGVSLVEEGGFGSGLRDRIERRHREKQGRMRGLGRTAEILGEDVIAPSPGPSM